MKLTHVTAVLALLPLGCLIVSLHAGGDGTVVNDPIRGGQMWDKWWVVAFAPEPTGDHPLYPKIGQKTGSTTYRCKECHGWDYKGAAGAYASGSHFTGIPGVFGSSLTEPQMFDLIKFDEGTVANGHGFGALGMNDQDINDVVEFLQTLVIDTDTLIDGANEFIGDAFQGETNYASGGIFPCLACHGANGTTINFGTPEDPEWVGTVAVGNPWEFQHKIRFGQPGTAMPSWLESNGGVDQDVADLGRYIQLNFPTGPCAEDLDDDLSVGFSDILIVIAAWGQSGVDEDVNGDGIVDVLDLLQLIGAWGPC